MKSEFLPKKYFPESHVTSYEEWKKEKYPLPFEPVDESVLDLFIAEYLNQNNLNEASVNPKDLIVTIREYLKAISQSPRFTNIVSGIEHESTFRNMIMFQWRGLPTRIIVAGKNIHIEMNSSFSGNSRGAIDKLSTDGVKNQQAFLRMLHLRLERLSVSAHSGGRF